VTLKPLSNLKYLTMLKASNNKLTKLLDMKFIIFFYRNLVMTIKLKKNREVPYNLEEVDCSFNEIDQIRDLSAHKFLKKLNLNNNRISQI
jgi:protein phosphatase 1 regulatory subunit 7